MGQKYRSTIVWVKNKGVPLYGARKASRLVISCAVSMAARCTVAPCCAHAECASVWIVVGAWTVK